MMFFTTRIREAESILSKRPISYRKPFMRFMRLLESIKEQQEFPDIRGISSSGWKVIR